MAMTSSTPNARLLQIRQRATFGRAVRPPIDSAPAPAAPFVQSEATPAMAAPASGDGIEGSRRHSRRVMISDEIGIRRIGGFNFHARLHDVSCGGCRVELLEEYETGDQLIARLPKLEPLGGRVRWATGTTAGVEFMSTIHPAVFDSLLLRLSARPTPSNDQAAPVPAED
jgi:hypothetical protein